MRDPPWQWDLRRLGWTLCHGESGRRAECRHVLLVDARALRRGEREGMAAADWPAWRLLMLGVEEPAERAALLTLGCAEALAAAIGLRELEARARRIDEMFGMLPRWRTVGPLTLDLFHRDARRAGRWLALHPREFGVLWRLADAPGKRVTRQQLLRDVWRLNHEPETNSVEVHVSRLRGKLAELGCEGLVMTDPRGGYRLGEARPFMLGGDGPPEEDALDAYLRERAPWAAEAAWQDG
jgi:DNA-binding winged helix-turn-helix (wHTH) protein